jgi:tetratricopeptide (TPR) repeat protein
MSEHEVWNELGSLFALSNSYTQAIRAYKKALILKPDFGAAVYNLAQLYAETDQHSEAAKCYRQSVELLEIDRQALALYRLGNSYLQIKEYEQAMEAYQKADQLNPDIRQVLELLERNERFLSGEAIDDIQKPPEEQPDVEKPTFDSAGLSGMGLYPFIEELTPWWFEGQTLPEDTPEGDVDSGYFMEPSIADPGGNIICTEPLQWHITYKEESVLEINNPSNETQVAATIEQDLSDLSAVVETVAAKSENEESSKAKESELTTPEILMMEEISETFTNLPDISEQTTTDLEAVQYQAFPEIQPVALSDEKQIEIKANIEKLKRTLDINHQNPVAWDALGESYKSLGKYEDAIQAYRKAATLDSSKAFYFHHLGLVLAAIGNTDEAINAFERVLELDPDHSLAHAALGGHYRKHGNEELAQSHIIKARELLDLDENEYNRACLEAICGNTDQAFDLLEIALQKKSTLVNWAYKDPDLDFIRKDPRFHIMLSEHAVKPA